ncbi:MAG: tetraacyldisaccharide 4'-kinase [Elusimicrobia bacterium GWA2_61_42]|nr:MAG: tetraacyldisaccharide 4'-kinase [Elusimicrobia bacterium GWA2_61_42]OGR74730.1 MAG: tetraacyldisaccharide 4'-kinase [Elusimicrobia bacterium GWC2_61_25]
MNDAPFSPEKLRDRLKENFSGRALLAALSLVYSAAIAARKGLYAAGLLRSRRLGVPVICFGNISSGGTGKTSTVVAAAQELARTGRRPAILLRGYKRKSSALKVVVLARGRVFRLEDVGDEALMLYRMLEKEGVPVLVSADRCASGSIAVKELGADILLMDDGFQHFALERDADIVLVNATAPFYADRVLPYGDLREPAAGLARARAVIISHCEQAQQEAIDKLGAKIKELNPAAEIIESMHTPEFFLDPSTAHPVDLNVLKGRPAVALSAIGDPDSFEGALKKMKIDLKQIWRYPDHHAFTPAELAAAQQARGGLPLITTYKDFARFPEGWQDILKGGVLILSVKIVFLCDGWKRLSAVLTEAGKPGKGGA